MATRLYIAKTLQGLESVLADELISLGATEVQPATRNVSFTADKKTMYKINYNVFTAIRILESFYNFTFDTLQEFYEQIRSLKWEIIIDKNASIAVDASVFNSAPFNNSHFAELKAKDAIVDYFRDKFGIRPNVSKDSPDLLVNIFVNKNYCHVSLDTSGVPLYKRGYRVLLHEASINEVLAAGMIRLSGWDGSGYFYDPMCGGGTIPIEASFFAMKLPAGYYRQHWGFMNWNSFDTKAWQEVVEESGRPELPKNCTISASDISFTSIQQARKNIASARLMKMITLEKKSFFDLKPLSAQGILIFNPPYNKRLPVDDIIQLYTDIGNTLKQSFNGHTAWIISNDHQAIKHIGLKPSKKHILFNGPDECRYHKFDCY